jgi:hypothetical protein
MMPLASIGFIFPCWRGFNAVSLSFAGSGKTNHNKMLL